MWESANLTRSLLPLANVKRAPDRLSIYSTFLQRSFDQIFQEVALQDLPVVFMLDRAGLTGPDGPTHHGLFDISYMRVFPNMVCMAPGYASEVSSMLDFAIQHDHPTSIRYPKASALQLDHEVSAVELGKSEKLRDGKDGTIVAFGAMVENALEAAELLEGDLDVAVINARFAKPIDYRRDGKERGGGGAVCDHTRRGNRFRRFRFSVFRKCSTAGAGYSLGEKPCTSR